MKKTLLLTCLLAPLLAHGELAPTKQARQFDQAAEDLLFGKRDHINPTTSELRSMARAQGTLKDKNGVVIPPVEATQPGNAPREVPPAPSYWTMHDAAKAGVDPLMLRPMASKAPIPAASNVPSVWAYAGGFALFAVLAIVVYLFSIRGFIKRED